MKFFDGITQEQMDEVLVGDYAACKGLVADEAGAAIIDKDDLSMCFQLLSEAPMREEEQVQEMAAKVPFRDGYDRWHLGIFDKERPREFGLPVDVLTAGNEIIDAMFVIGNLQVNQRSVIGFVEVSTPLAVLDSRKHKATRFRIQRALSHHRKRKEVLVGLCRFWFAWLYFHIQTAPAPFTMQTPEAHRQQVLGDREKRMNENAKKEQDDE